jgi:hypothetical protein
MPCTEHTLWLYILSFAGHFTAALMLNPAAMQAVAGEETFPMIGIAHVFQQQNNAELLHTAALLSCC